MFVRTGEMHGFSEEDATNPANQYAFKASQTPTRDWALYALQQAQDRYFKAFPEARKHAASLLWEIEKVDGAEGQS